MSDLTHRRLKAGMVIIENRISPPPGECINCHLDAEGCTLTTWTFVGPPNVHPMCFWCLELWDVRGWLGESA